MSELPVPETIILATATAMYAIAAIIGIAQLRAGTAKYRRLMQPVVCLAIVFEMGLLMFRAAAIKAIPLTGLFESMIVLTVVFGLIYLFLSIAVRQVWFSSVMVWVILAMVLLTWTVAKPASEPAAVAATPWAIAHGIAMILGGVAITFATASAILYLFATYKLKQKQIMQVLGKVPNLEKLESMNLLGIRAGFLFITVGVISGLGMALTRLAVMGTSVTEWLTDGKVICIITAWIILAFILALNHLLLLKSKARACMTIAVFVLILFAILGVTILGATHHNFATHQLSNTSMIR
jgi:ABC-type uncharacterized transport system permease subunit